MSGVEDALRALAGWMNPPKEEKPVEYDEDQVIGFYPRQKYLDNNWAPESRLSSHELTAIAKARKLAETTGVLTPEQGEKLLPIAMVENWGLGMGIKDTNNFYASQRFRKDMERLGLEAGKDLMPSYIKGELHYAPNVTDANGPRLAALILAEKSKLKGVNSLDDAIRRYNGKGKATEHYYGTAVPADVEEYLRKVNEAHTMLPHPKNAPFLTHYNTAYKNAR